MNTMDEIKKLLNKVKKYHDGEILGFPGSVPLEIAKEAFNLAMEINSNAIMLHFKGKSLEETSGGKESEAFAPIYQMEIELLMWITVLFQGEKGKTLKEIKEEWKDKNVWGYMTSGGDRKQYFCFVGCEKLFSAEIS